MAAKIPLNKFRSIYMVVPLLSTYIYEAPSNRASIIINAQATNFTDKEASISLWVRREGKFFPIVYNLPIPAYDSRSLISGRVVLQGPDNETIFGSDSIFVQQTSSTGLTAISLSLGWLEVVNIT
jgi:hypothetical protein